MASTLPTELPVQTETKIQLQANTNYLWLKKHIDKVVVVLSFPFLLPIFLIIALAIKMCDRGPVFYKALRYGSDGRFFIMIKFRTMKVGADKVKKNGKKNPEDPCITRVGRFLRKTSLDELAQIFNILRGEMSLVGPRPSSFSRERKLQNICSGITGLWQVSSERGNGDDSIRQEIDEQYARQVSFFLDVKILFLTIGSVIKRKGA